MAGAPAAGCSGADPSDRRGFTLVELLVAMVILTVGLLALAGGMSVVVGSVAQSGVEIDRTAAFQSGMETVRSIEFDDLEAGSDSIGPYEVSWEVTRETQNWKDLDLVVDGPAGRGAGRGAPILSHSVADTFSYTVMRP